MRFQKSQVLVEFALVLPLFLLLIFSIIYFSMIFLDYMTLSTVARNSAREAAVANATEYANDYKVIRDHYQNQSLPVDIYDWNPTATSDFKIEYQAPENQSEHGNVLVTIHADFNEDGSWLANIVNTLSDNKNTKKLNLNITCTMYSEDNWKTQK